MSSRLIEENEDYLILERYVHDEPDEYAEWELDSKGSEKYPKEVHLSEHYALSEIKVKYRIDKTTGEVLYLEFDGMGLPT